MTQTVQIYRSNVNTPPSALLPGAFSAELGPETKLWIGSGTGNRLLMSSDPGDESVVSGLFLPISGGTLTGPLVLAGPPTDPLNAVTKSYVDTLPAHASVSPTPPGLGLPGELWWSSEDGQLYVNYADADSSQWVVANSSSGAYLSLAGGTMVGSLVLAHDPVLPLEAATKQYVDVADAALVGHIDSEIASVRGEYLPLVGGVLTGRLTIAPTAGLSSELVLQKAASGVGNDLYGFSGGSGRWLLQLGSGAPETGGNAGSDFVIQRYSDTGVYLGAALDISRATGFLNVYGQIKATDAVVSAGINACFQFEIRDTPGAYWLWYATAGEARLWAGVDKLRVSNAGDLTSIGAYHYFQGASGAVTGSSGPLAYGDANWFITKPGFNNLGWLWWNYAGAEKMRLAGDTGILSINGAGFLGSDGGYNKVYDNSGAVTFYLGGATLGYTNYYRQNTHAFDDRAENRYLTLAPGVATFHTPLVLGVGPSAAEHATRKDYVDGQVGVAWNLANTKVARTGDTMSGALSVPLIYGGAAGAGTLRTHGATNSVNFRWDNMVAGQLAYRVDETVERFISSTVNVFNTYYGVSGGPTTWAFFGEDIGRTVSIIYVDGFSDERIKDDIRPTEVDALAVLKEVPVSQFSVKGPVAAWLRNVGMDLPGRIASMQDAEPVHVPIGLVAQRIAVHMPDAVTVVRQDDAIPEAPLPVDVHAINKSEFVPYLVRAIQQLAARVEALEAP